ncbi:hypothetical protein XELAEV_18046428mg [Xenopus laevis]|uniref:Endonuclease/exonuclease/phosphatase domain-containing protein n=1 Tax=Xenopus laevis TaxID=8355 RepID=A0A974H0K9_XENLA|nr:hypothetical protein XELAEV_18046428mg [Xenopus laevis]
MANTKQRLAQKEVGNFFMKNPLESNKTQDGAALSGTAVSTDPDFRICKVSPKDDLYTVKIDKAQLFQLLHLHFTILNNIIKYLALINVWRCLHPRTRDFTFYSAPHNSHSRIAYVYVSQSAISNVTEAKIVPIAWSDHTSVFVSLHIPDRLQGKHLWRLKESILSDGALCSKITDAFENYWIDNLDESLSISMLWAAHKSTICGVLISIVAHKNKVFRNQILSLEREVTNPDQTHKLNPNPQSLESLMQDRQNITTPKS